MKTPYRAAGRRKSTSNSQPRDHLPNQVLFDEIGNDVEMWMASAQQLLCSKKSLEKARRAAEKEMRDGSIPEDALTLWPETMLLGFAVENLLKAYWVAKGNKLYEAGTLTSRLKSHDLLGLAGKVSFDIREYEQPALERLATIMVGIGRYPLSVKCPRHGTFESWSTLHDRRVNVLIERLRTEIAAMLTLSAQARP